MNTVFHNKRISGILGILPEKSYLFTDEMEGGDSPRNKKIAKNMGYHSRYRVKHGTTTADLCVRGLQYLLGEGRVKKEEIGAVIVLTVTPDFFVPHVSNQIHGACDLPLDVWTMDIWDGCAGYVNGLFHAFLYADKMPEKKILLFTADILNRGGGELFSEPPFGGDGAAITIIESTRDSENIPFLWETDGEQKDLIAFYQGAFYDMFHENKMNRDSTFRDANASFRYFQQVVPDAVKRFMDKAGFVKDDIDRFYFIQANKLSVKKMADSLVLPYEKVPMDLVEKYGDMSAALNPIGIVDDLKDIIDDKSYLVMIVGYGAGTRWGVTALTIEAGTRLEFMKTDL